MNNRVSESQLRQICVSVEKRVSLGEQHVADSIFESQPSLVSDSEAAIEVVYREYVALETAGLEPPRADLLDRYPQWREQLQNLFEVHDALVGGDVIDSAVTPSSRNLESVGAIIGKYKLLQEIGEGGFGVVFMAEQLEPLRRKVALKIIKPGMDTRAAVARFEAERQALAMMEHPNISRVLDAGATENGRPYFVMDLVKGIPITEFCDKKNLSTVERLRLFVTVCHAVQHAHSKGIIHRDLKPSNVMITLHDGEPVPKIIDFGISKALNQQLTEKTLFTRYGQMLGTPMYMSPEQAEMSGLDIDTRSDIYSLGVLLYELLTGTPPFSAERLRTASYADMVKIIVEEEPPTPGSRLQTMGDTLGEICQNRATDPKQLFRLLRSDLERIVMKSVEKDRKRRYETVSDLARDVERYLNDEPVLASSPSRMYRLQKFTRRNRALVFSTVAVVSALTLGLVFALAGLVDARHQRQLAVSAQTQERHHRQSAELEKENARLARDAEHAQRLQVETNLYFQRISRAHREWLSGNLHNAIQTLDACLVENRDWEWHFLQRLCHPSAQTLHGHTNAVSRVAFSPDGRLVASSSSRWNDAQSGEVILWDRKTGRQLHVFGSQPGGLWALSFSSDSRQLAIVNNFRGGLSVWNVAAGSIAFAHADQSLNGVDFSPAGDLLATAGSNGEVRIFDAHDGSLLRILRNSSSPAFEVSFSPNGRLVAAVTDAGVANIWNASTGELLHQLSGAGNRTLDFSPDGRLLATGGYAGSYWGIIKIFQVNETKTVVAAEHYTNFGTVGHIQFSPDNQLLAISGSSSVVRVWEPLTGRERYQFKAHQGVAAAVAFSPDGRQLATGSHDQMTRLWTLSQTGPLARADRAFVRSLAFSPDNQRIALAGSFNNSSPERGDKTIQIWRLWEEDGDQALASVLSGFDEWMTSITYCPTGARLAAAGDTGGIHVWNEGSGATLLDFEAHSGAANSVIFSSDGLRLVSGGDDGFVRIWDAESGHPLHEWTGQQAAVTCVVHHPNRDLLVTAGEDGSVKLWHALSGDRLQVVVPPNEVAVTRAAISQDGRLLATGDETGKIRLWTIQANASMEADFPQQPETVFYDHVHTFEGHTQTITGLSFHPGNSRLASISMDGSVATWDVNSFNEAIRLTPVGQNLFVLAVAFSPSGERLAVARANEITLWNSRELGSTDVDSLTATRRAIAWHEQMARECAGDLNWFGAVFHSDRLLELKPSDATYLANRGLAYAALGDWEQARDNLRQASELGRKRTNDQYVLALAQLQLGDQEGYRQSCWAAVNSLGDAFDARAGNSAAWVCALGPNALEDFSVAIKLVERALENTTGYRRYSYSNTYGTLLLRAGNYEAAIEKIYEGLAFSGTANTPHDWLVLALAHQRLGHTEEANQWFNQAAWEIARLELSNVPDPTSWSRLALMQLFRDEVASELRKSLPEEPNAELVGSVESRPRNWLHMSIDKRQLVAWHLNELTLAEQTGDFLAAIAHLDFLIDSLPAVPETYLRRSKAHARIALLSNRDIRMNSAREDYRRATKSETGGIEGLLLTGSGEHVAAPHLPLDKLKEFTIEAWVNREWRGAVLSQGNAGESENSLWLSTVNDSSATRFKTFGWDSDEKSKNLVGSLPPLTEAWNHIAMAFDGEYRTIFVNGKLIESDIVPRPGAFHRDSFLIIGAYQHGNFSSATGKIRSVRISDKVKYRQDFSPHVNLETDDATMLLYDFASDGSWIETGIVSDKSVRHNNAGQIRNAWWIKD